MATMTKKKLISTISQ
ncbi:bacterial DNA-binding family protein, partial [Chlamydia psittaci 84-8471/1]